VGRTWVRSALKGALWSVALATLVALCAGTVRIFPWVLDPAVSFRVAAPFARSLAVVGAEAALAVGWPVGWALATVSFVERGEARVVRLLGEAPLRTTARLAPQGVLLACALALVSWESARAATEPGRVMTELIAEGEVACATAAAPRSYVVPFLGATWLCAPGLAPRLVGPGPGPLSALVISARRARVSGDVGDISLDDARVAVAAPSASLHVDSLHVVGAAPWGHASSVSPWVRAVALGLAVPACALLVVLVLLQSTRAGRTVALAVGGLGPLLALSTLRALERTAHHGWLMAFAVVAAACAPAVLLAGVARLPRPWHAASRSFG
jgi:hypothetical protein